jgi:hypothetical protein
VIDPVPRRGTRAGIPPPPTYQNGQTYPVATRPARLPTVYCRTCRDVMPRSVAGHCTDCEATGRDAPSRPPPLPPESLKPQTVPPVHTRPSLMLTREHRVLGDPNP